MPWLGVGVVVDVIVVPFMSHTASAPVMSCRQSMSGLPSQLKSVFRGTAGRSALEGIQIAGKTGTAQRTGERDHAWFVGFAPAEDPKIVVAVFLEHGEHGSDAAFIASRIIVRYLKRPAAPIPVTEEGE